MTKTTFVLILLALSLQTFAADTCKVAYLQRISSQVIDADASGRIQNSALEDLATLDGITLVAREDAEYIVEVHALENMDAHNANTLNSIAHLSLTAAVDNKLFSYSMHFGKYNFHGRRSKAYSEENFERAVLKAIDSVIDCSTLKKNEAESRARSI